MSPKALRGLVAFAVSGALVAFLLSRLDLASAFERFRSADPAWLVAAAALSLVVLFLRGIRFSSLSDRARLPLTTAAVAVQVFLNRVTPFRLGELSLPWLLGRHAGEDGARALVRLLLVRLVDLLVVAGAVVVAAASRAGSGGPALLPTAALLGLLLAVLFTFRRWLSPLLNLIRRAVALAGLGKVGAIDRVLSRLAGAASDGDALRPRQRVTVALTSLGVFVVQMAMFAAILRAFGIGLPVEALALGGAVAQAGAAVPVASVGTFGTQEASWVAGYVWAGLPMEDAIVTAIASQLLTLLFAALFALPAWLWLERRPPVAAAEAK
ncbi:lysylphosphatidylglycerol synthase domain-containing protein [Vulgatibacter incomptus]|uniref:Dolichol-P-glucose synthetase n=1 Tax=Vulgatibacter incomptus TaxID=1391653 RepID=A0A0K1PEK5_9BACT|nr:lysylphosphatidylglycerol synthase domain-containing protein [Vulgatibacter incomptus]AKU91945.1 hypothetical protein AKJ08_2332 [Vulgatibacter incomptus]